MRENDRVTGHSLIIMSCEATQWPTTHYFNECPSDEVIFSLKIRHCLSLDICG